jgi:hypothetical protein
VVNATAMELLGIKEAKLVLELMPKFGAKMDVRNKLILN